MMGVDRLRLGRRLRHSHKRRGQRLGHAGHLRLREIMFRHMPAKHLGRLDRHWRIDPDGDLGQATGGHQGAEQVDELLAAADRKRRHEHHAAPGQRLLRHCLQLVERSTGGMIAVAIGALADEVVAGGSGQGIVVERCVVTADIPGENEPPRAGSRGHLHFDERTAEHVPGIVKATTDARRRFEPCFAGHRLHQPECAINIPLVIERQCWLVLRIPFSIGILGVFSLALGGVVEQQPEQVGRRRGGEDGTLESLPDQPRQPA